MTANGHRRPFPALQKISPSTQQRMNIKTVWDTYPPGKYGSWTSPVSSKCVFLSLLTKVVLATGSGGYSIRETSRLYWDTVDADVKLFVLSDIRCLPLRGLREYLDHFDPLSPVRPLAGFRNSIILAWVSRPPMTKTYSWCTMITVYMLGYIVHHPILRKTLPTLYLTGELCLGLRGPSCLTALPTFVKRLCAFGTWNKLKNHFTQPYCPWRNGAAEWPGKEILQACRSLISEILLRVDSWFELIPIIKSALSHSPSLQRINIASVAAFSGLKHSRSIMNFSRSETSTIVMVIEAELERYSNLSDLIARMKRLRPIVQDAVTKNWKRVREHTSRGRLANFSEEDYILVAREVFYKWEKLCLQ